MFRSCALGCIIVIQVAGMSGAGTHADAPLHLRAAGRGGGVAARGLQLRGGGGTADGDEMTDDTTHVCPWDVVTGPGRFRSSTPLARLHARPETRAHASSRHTETQCCMQGLSLSSPCTFSKHNNYETPLMKGEREDEVELIGTEVNFTLFRNVETGAVVELVDTEDVPGLAGSRGHAAMRLCAMHHASMRLRIMLLCVYAPMHLRISCARMSLSSS
jgi:hypothetical protein